MLNEVLENSKNELMQIIQKSEGLQTRKVELEEEMQETKAAILKLNQENRGLSIYRKRQRNHFLPGRRDLPANGITALYR